MSLLPDEWSTVAEYIEATLNAPPAAVRTAYPGVGFRPARPGVPIDEAPQQSGIYHYLAPSYEPVLHGNGQAPVRYLFRGGIRIRVQTTARNENAVATAAPLTYGKAAAAALRRGGWAQFIGSDGVSTIAGLSISEGATIPRLVPERPVAEGVVVDAYYTVDVQYIAHVNART